MTDVRDIYRSHESLVDGAVERLLPGAIARSRRMPIRTRALAASAAVAVVAIIAGVTFVISTNGSADDAGPDHQRPPAGYRLISSLGTQLAVPDAWKINDIPTCGHIDTVGTVVRGASANAGCGLTTPLTKDFAEIETQYVAADAFGPLPTAATTSHVTVDGVSAVRSTASSGTYHYGWIIIESRDVEVYVRTHDDAQLNTILGSLRLVTTDFLGCPVQPPSTRPAALSGPYFIDPAPRSIAICSYLADGTDRRLNASALMKPPASTTLAARINAAPAGTDPPRPPVQCSYTELPLRTDMLLIVTSATGAQRRIAVAIAACAGARFDNGRSYRQITNEVAILIMDAASIGGVLPE